MTKGYSNLLKTKKTFRIVLIFFFCYSVLSASLKAENKKQTTQTIKEAVTSAINSANVKSEALNAAISDAAGLAKTDETNKINLTPADNNKREKADDKCLQQETQKIPANANVPVDEKQRLKEKAGGKKKLKSGKQDPENPEAGSESAEYTNGSDACDGSLTDGNNNASDAANNEAVDANNLKQTPAKKLKKVKVNWFNTKLKAKDLGVNSQGDLYVVGLDGKLYKYEFLTDSWCLMEGDFELTRINRVDVNWDGMPYVTTDIGDTFFLGCDHKWTRLPGCATDIGIGRGGEVYKTGCDKRNTGFGIYRLYCTCPTTCCYKGCQNWRKPCRFAWTHKSDDWKCEWFRIEGNGIKIDVAPSGNPYTIDVSGTILQYDGTIWKKVAAPSLAFDLTISNDGVLFYTGQDGKIYKSANESNGTWEVLNGEADAITAGPFSQPWVIRNSDKSVLGSSKFEYN